MIGLWTQYVREWLWGRWKGPADFSITFPSSTLVRQRAQPHQWQSRGQKKSLLRENVIYQTQLILLLPRILYASKGPREMV